MQRPKLGMERTLTGKRETNNILLIFDIDVSIPIQLMDESRVILEAKDMELQTVHQVGDGQDESSLLMQAICLGSIVAWIQDADDTRHPILSPFGYHASVQRISGTRFLDGVLSGLMVQGRHSCGICNSCAHLQAPAIRFELPATSLAGCWQWH